MRSFKKFSMTARLGIVNGIIIIFALAIITVIILNQSQYTSAYFSHIIIALIFVFTIFVIVQWINIQNEARRAGIILNTNPLCFILYDEQLNFIDCNEEGIKLFGLKSKEELEKYFWDLLPEYQANGAFSREESSRFMKIALEKGRITSEWLCQKFDGTPLPVEVTMDRVIFGEQKLLCIYARDLTEQQAMSTEVEYQSALLHAVNDISAKLFCSDSGDFFTGLYDCMEFLAKVVSIHKINIWKNSVINDELCCTQICEWLDAEKHENQSKQEIAASYKQIFPEWENLLSNGYNIKNLVKNLSREEQNNLVPQGIISLLVIPILAEDSFWGFIGFYDCNTERDFTPMEESCLNSGALLIANALIREETREKLVLAREEALTASRAKSNFLSNMSHEIRTPMNAIIGMTSIGMSAITVERKDYAFGKISDASSHLLGVINDILDLSKIEAEKFELSLCEFNFEKMLQKTVEVITFRVEEKLQTLSVNLGHGIPHFVIGDSQRLAQVITNLLSNAVKFTPEAGVITLNAFLVDRQDDIVTIQVEIIDSGIGITEEQQSRLFNSFVQAENSTSRKYGGTGLGLVISKRIVEMMNGRIWIESESGKGTKLAFTVQLQKGMDLVDTANTKRQNIRIMAVDNDLAVLEFFSEITRRCEINCLTAFNGEQVLEAMEQNGFFNLYFIAWKLPGMDGLELSRRILEKSGNEKPYIVLISGYDLRTIEKEARELGIVNFLCKPLFPSSIVDCIYQLLRQEDNNPVPIMPPDDSSVVKKFPGRHVLIVDDVDINREILISMLEDTGLETSCATNGKEAVNIFIENRKSYDLIFMDVQMPEMDGFEATRCIRMYEAEQLTEEEKSVPIIAMTANVFREDIERCLAAGMNNHIGKPVDIENLFDVLRKYLKN